MRVEIQNPDGLIKPGMLGRATLPTGESRKAVLVPKDALVFTSTGTAVFTVVEQKADFVPVRMGPEHGSLIEVEREIVDKQEEFLKNVEGLVRMTSESSDGVGRVNLEFSVGTDIDAALLRVSTKLDQVPEYPDDAWRPAK